MALLDTHVVLWWATGDPRLSARAAREVARADTVHISGISFWEIATFLRKGRLRLDREVHRWVADVLAQERVTEVPVSATVATLAGSLDDGFPGDPSDRVLYATARDLAVPLISKDVALRSYARSVRDVRVIW